MIRVLLVDDHAVVREGYRRLLERHAGIEVVGEAADAAGAYAAFQRLAPDLVVMDVSLPDTSGIEAMRRILARDPRARILMFSMHEEAIFAQRAFLAGACGYITKSSAPETLVQAVRHVAGGERYLGPETARTLAMASVAGCSIGLDALSAREFEVMRLLASGKSVATIATHLNLSVKTVANHQSVIRQKLGIENPVQLLQLAARLGLVDDGGPA